MSIPGGQGAHAQFAAAEAQLERALEDSLVDGDDDFYDDSDEDTHAANGDEDSPPSFSRVDLCQSDSQIAQQFPSFPVGALPIIIPLCLGDYVLCTLKEREPL